MSTDGGREERAVRATRRGMAGGRGVPQGRLERRRRPPSQPARRNATLATLEPFEARGNTRPHVTRRRPGLCWEGHAPYANDRRRGLWGASQKCLSVCLSVIRRGEQVGQRKGRSSGERRARVWACIKSQPLSVSPAPQCKGSRVEGGVKRPQPGNRAEELLPPA